MPEIDKWSVYQSFPNAYILHRIKNDKVEYAPLFCVRLKVNNYKHCSYNGFDEIDDTIFGGAVKKQRIENHMTIKQVANAVGLSVDTIMRIEQNKYDLDNAYRLKKLCDILNLDTQKICSPYQLFLLNNQGEQIKSYRIKLNITQFEFANIFLVNKKTISKWENNKSQMPYEKWEIFNQVTETTFYPQ